MIDNYLVDNKLITNKPIHIICEYYHLVGSKKQVDVTINDNIEILDINQQSLLFRLNNNDYIYHNQNIDEFIHQTFVEQKLELDFI